MAEEKLTRSRAASLCAGVFALVRACPEGRVTTYGWLGKALGYPRGARVIGWIMNDTPEDVPAQRVINSKGELSGSWAFGPAARMRQLLEAEGIVFTDEGRVDLKRYGWDPNVVLSEEERASLLQAATTQAPAISERLVHLFLRDPASPFRAEQDATP